MICINSYCLRPVEKTDLGWIKDLRNSVLTWPALGTVSLLDSFKQQEWFEKVSADRSQEYLVFYCNEGKKNLGIVRLTKIDRINRSMCVGGDIKPTERGKKHAKYMYKLIFKLGFEVWGLHRLWLLALATNKTALALYNKMGFVEEGAQRQAVFRDGMFVDYMMLSILEDEYWKSKK